MESNPLKLYASHYSYSFHDYSEIRALMAMVVNDMRNGNFCTDGLSSSSYAFTNNRTYYVDFNEYDNSIDIYYSIGRDQSIFAEYKKVKRLKIKLGLLKIENYNDYTDQDDD